MAAGNNPSLMLLNLFKPRSLDALAVRCRTDKSHLVHNFAQFYDSYFAPLRDKPVKLLEIGVGRGASIRMWKRYFPKGKMFAIESEPRRGKYRYLGAKLYVGRQENRDFLRKVVDEIGPLDIIIDDGSHRVDDQQITLGCLFPYLKEGGHYIIEDIHTSFPNQALDFGLAPDSSNSTYQMLLDFKSQGEFKSRYLSPTELQYLNDHVALCDVYAHQDETKHLTSLLRKTSTLSA
jgi:hypothetical protein